MDHHRAGHPSRVSRTHPSAPLTSPAARRRRNPNPSPPSWGGGGPQPAGGRRPQAARHQTPVARAASCRLARALGRVRGRGAFGPPSGGRDQPKENHGRAPDRGPPPPRRRAAAMGRGRPGRASTGPACTRPAAYLSGPARHLRGRAGHRHGGGPGRRALCARDSGRAEGPRGGRIRTRSDGAGCFRSGTGWGEVRIEAGAVPPGRGAASAAKKMAGGLSPRLDTTGRKKCGEDALSPPLAVTADTRYPPVRRSSPKRTRCRPVPCALAMRRLPRPPSCLP